MKAVLILLLAAGSYVQCHRLLLQQSSPLPSPEPWPPEWDVPIKLMSRGDLLERGGAMRALGVEKLRNISKYTSVGIGVDSLANILDTDDDLFVDVANNRLLHKCRGLKEPADPVNTSALAWIAAAAAPAQTAPAVTFSEAFSLSSRPSSKKKIYLDFDGHTVAGTDWNKYYKKESMTIPPYDIDGDTGSFSDKELANIKEVWTAVVEDFAPFDVDVTTKHPGDQVLKTNGVRAVIGGVYTDLGNDPAGGIAWTGSFGTGEPCFVFSKPLYGEPREVAESVSHEVGHTLGLLHDGTVSGIEYYAGHGNWAPIMGLVMEAYIGQWDRGEYAESNNDQDDIAVISSFLDILPQQYGSSIATATALSSGGQVSGIVSKAGQVDYFAFQAKSGPVTVSAKGPGSLTNRFGRTYYIGNLDMRLMLHNAGGASIAESNPAGATADGMGAYISTTLPSDGTYYISITGVGAGNPKTDGYSNYGSLGQYTITIGSAGDGSTSPNDCIGNWEPWSECSKSCGGGTQTSTYHISRPAKDIGRPCEATEGQLKSSSCNTQPCQQNTPSPSPIFGIPPPSPNPGGAPVDCLGSWGPWSECSQACGGGSQVTTFSVTVPARNGGSLCETSDGAKKGRLCNTQACQQGSPSPSPLPGLSPSPTPGSSPKPGGGSVTVMRVADVDLRRVTVVLPSGRTRYKCKAVVTIKTAAGAQVAKARVLGRWSADSNSAALDQDLTRTTNATGAATFTSKLVDGSSCSFAVQQVSLAGYSWRRAGVGTKSLAW